jgi:hypothetical protein
MILILILLEFRENDYLHSLQVLSQTELHAPAGQPSSSQQGTTTSSIVRTAIVGPRGPTHAFSIGSYKRKAILSVDFLPEQPHLF